MSDLEEAEAADHLVKEAWAREAEEVASWEQRVLAEEDALIVGRAWDADKEEREEWERRVLSLDDASPPGTPSSSYVEVAAASASFGLETGTVLEPLLPTDVPVFPAYPSYQSVMLKQRLELDRARCQELDERRQQKQRHQIDLYGARLAQVLHSRAQFAAAIAHRQVQAREARVAHEQSERWEREQAVRAFEARRHVVETQRAGKRIEVEKRMAETDVLRRQRDGEERLQRAAAVAKFAKTAGKSEKDAGQAAKHGRKR